MSKPSPLGSARTDYREIGRSARSPHRTDAELDALTTLGTGVMLWANIPLMLTFGFIAMKAYVDYMHRLDAGEFHPHAARSITDVVEGKDVE